MTKRELAAALDAYGDDTPIVIRHDDGEYCTTDYVHPTVRTALLIPDSIEGGWREQDRRYKKDRALVPQVVVVLM